MYHKSPLQPERKPIGSNTKSIAGLRHRSMKARPKTKGFLEENRLKTNSATTKQTMSSTYGKAEDVNCCQL
jgi:hypothetical protein